MKDPLSLLLVAAIVLPLVAAPAGLLAEPAPLVIYQNDFTKRTSLEPIGGLSTGSYRPGELVSTRVGDTGQDSWVRRHGAKAATVVEHDGNRYVELSHAVSQSNTGFVCQCIGSTVSQGVLRVSVDLLAPSSWAHATSPQSRVALGDRCTSFVQSARRPDNGPQPHGKPVRVRGRTRTPTRPSASVAYDRAVDKGLVLRTNDAARVNGGCTGIGSSSTTIWIQGHLLGHHLLSGRIAAEFG